MVTDSGAMTLCLAEALPSLGRVWSASDISTQSNARIRVLSARFRANAHVLEAQPQ